MDWTKQLAYMGIKILFKDDHNLILETIKTIDTLFFVSSTNRWRLDRMESDDVYKDGKMIEKNILYYYR